MPKNVQICRNQGLHHLSSPDLNQLRIPLRLNRTIAQLMSKQQIEDSKMHARKSQRSAVAPGRHFIMEFDRSDGRIEADAIIRDISDDGAGLWVGCFIHPNTRCWLAFDTPDGSKRVVEGNVRWCKHFTHSVHEVGIQIRREEAKILIESLQQSGPTNQPAVVDIQAALKAVIKQLQARGDQGLSADETNKLCEQLCALIIKP